jgi:hypothetical protein
VINEMETKKRPKPKLEMKTKGFIFRTFFLLKSEN